MTSRTIGPAEAPIAAIATAPGPAGVCVVRVSGAGALELGDRLVPGVRLKPSLRAGGTFFHARVAHPLTGEMLDDAVLLVYRAPHSYTGEDTLELQGHGGTFPARKLLDAALAAGARLAEPGEFTRRAFLNGRLDLTQVEAVCDFIQAKTERSAHVARAQLDGALGRSVNGLYEHTTGLCAEIEHLLDFDEGELPEAFGQLAAARVSALSAEMEALACTWHEGHLLRDGALVVLSGRPNAGKSSLLNTLLGRDRAIVHDAPGTTRDVIEESVALNGVPLRLVDTAGLRESGDAVEVEGMGRARALMQQADLNLYLVDHSVPWQPLPDSVSSLLAADRTLLVHTKCDLPPAAGTSHVTGLGEPVCLSAKTGAGIEALRAAVLAKLGLSQAQETCGQTVVALRQAGELRQAVGQARAAVCALAQGSACLVIAANHLRAAAEALGRIVGRTYSDDVLDAIFSRFCVGK